MRLTINLAALVVAGAVATVVAQGPKPITESVTIKATIEAIDQTTKMVTLKGPKGNLVNVDARNVARFDQLKVGDQVTATYSESVLVHLRKPGEPPPPEATSAVTRSEKDIAATATQQQTATVTIEAIDKSVPSVTVKAPDGRVLSFRVQDPKNLEGVKVGDKVDVTYTKALLMKVEPPVAPK